MDAYKKKLYKFVGQTFLYNLLCHAHGQYIHIEGIKGGNLNEEKLVDLLEDIFQDRDVFNYSGGMGYDMVMENLAEFSKHVIENQDELCKKSPALKNFYEVEKLLPITNKTIDALKELSEKIEV